MELEALLKAVEAAKLALAAKPDDEALETALEDAQKAYDEAKAKAELEVESDDFDETKADDKTKKYIAKLRNENAKHRSAKKDALSKLTATEEQKKKILKVLGLEDEEKPEDKITKLQAETQTKDFRLAILESALSHGVPKDQLDYYEFLITKATSALSDGEELDDEELVKIVLKVKGASGKKANSTVDDGGKGAPNPGAGAGQMNFEKFCGLSIIEKSKYFEKNPEQGAAWMKEARAKKKLV